MSECSNSLDSPKLTTLYRLDDANGNLLKWGITSSSNPRRRYTETYLQNKLFVPITTGSRRSMLRIERWMVQHHRGPRKVVDLIRRGGWHIMGAAGSRNGTTIDPSWK